MWTCPECGRTFARKNQDHYCTKKPETIDAYIALQDEAVQPVLQKTREVLKETLPDCEERISWQMPTYWKKHNIIHFAASKHHLGIYPGDKPVEAFQEELKDYSASKGSIRFPYDHVDYDLIARIAAYAYKVNSV